MGPLLLGNMAPPYTSYKNQSSTEPALGHESHGSPSSVLLCPFASLPGIISESEPALCSARLASGFMGTFMPFWTKGHGEKAESLHTVQGHGSVPL